MRLLIASIVKKYTFEMGKFIKFLLLAHADLSSPVPGQDMFLEDHFVGAPRGHETKMLFKEIEHL